ncbi:sensor histidine kinase [Vibrio sp. NTOU-M3]|uniref:sensor histidine kinase n=1 Tax=Vibrio sp. NTOU-M3 TaxID=3234954 RepID=UPI0035A91F92
MDNHMSHWRGFGKSLVFTSLFCLVIAVITKMIWSSAWGEHLAISFGYGYSAVFTAHLLSVYKPDLPYRFINLLSVTSSMIFGTANAHYWLKKYEKFSDFSDLQPVMALGLIFTVACFFYFYAYEQKIVAEKELEIAKRKQSEQEKALLLSQLNQLQSQIEPHFLFNTLANINVLIEQNPPSASKMLEKLTELLRATLKKSRRRLVTVEDELSLVDAYLAIHKIRLGNRLEYEVSVESSLRETLLPPMLLQPLVENAIQHGIEPKSDSGKVQVSITCDDELFHIRIMDTGVGLSDGNSTTGNGISLDNIRQRLHALFAGNASLGLSENREGGTTSHIAINRTALETLIQSNGLINE